MSRSHPHPHFPKMGRNLAKRHNRQVSAQKVEGLLEPALPWMCRPPPHWIFLLPLSGSMLCTVRLMCWRGVSWSSSSGTPGMFSSGCGIL